MTPPDQSLTLSECRYCGASCLIAYGLCHCGCGQKTNIPSRTSAKNGSLKGRPNIFILGHIVYKRKYRESIYPLDEPHDYYVYLYLRLRSSRHGAQGSPYYVGKGKGRRAWDRLHHGVGVPSEKNRIVIESKNLSEEEANKEEIRLIKLYGRINNNTGILRNLTNGGEGTSGLVITDSMREKISVANRGKIVSQESREKQAATKKRIFALKQEKQLTEYLDAFYARINGMKTATTFTGATHPAAQPQGRNRATNGG